MKKFFIILILLIKIVSSIEVSFSCPKEVYFNEDFECKIDILKNKMSYDGKITIKGDEKNINKIWEGTTWQRSDWYAKKLINGEKTFARIKVDKAFFGEANGEIKLRESTSQKVIYQENFKINILTNKTKEEIISNDSNESILESQIITENKEIKINSKDIKTKKSASLLENKPLGILILISLSLFTGLLYLRREKIKNGKRNYKEDTFDINN